MLSLSEEDIPKQTLKQNEFECLNMNITCPADLTPYSRLPVMVWIHGFVFVFFFRTAYIINLGAEVLIAVPDRTGFMTEGDLFAEVFFWASPSSWSRSSEYLSLE